MGVAGRLRGDHVISRKHGGITDLSNLALSCARCNRAEGTDVGSVSQTSGQFVRLFNPRIDRWEEHFRLEGAQIVGVTEWEWSQRVSSD